MQCNVQTGLRAVSRSFCLLFGLWLAQPVQADVLVQQLANEGFILGDGKATRVMIDGMVVEPYSVYGGLPAQYIEDFNGANGPFARINLVLVSHQHHDHNQPEHACKFIQNSIGVLATSQQVIDLMRERCRQFILSSPRIQVVDPMYEQPINMQVGDAIVTIFLLSHGSGKYASLDNYGHLVELGGLKVLHMGDAAMEATDFNTAGVADMEVDIALVPFWYFQPGPGGAMVRKFLTARHMIATHIPPGEMEEVKEFLRVEYPNVLILENPMDEILFED